MRKLLVQDAHGERELLFVGTMAVGRDPRCDISDPDELLSRRHAEFVAGQTDSRVRDLQSRNGILVNGVNVNEAVLRSGDVVRIARLTIQFVDDSSGDTQPPPAAAHDLDDKTIMVPPPIEPQRAPEPVPQQRSGPTTSPSWVTDDDDDSTRLVAPTVAAHEPRPAGPAKTSDTLPRHAGNARPSARRQPAAPSADRVVGKGLTRRTATRAPKTAWGTRVSLQVVSLAGAVFIAVAVPMWILEQRLLDRIATSRALAVGQWLAADASAAAEAGVVDQAALAVGAQPGVVSALLVGVDGRVLSPSARATEIVVRIPGVGLAIADVLRPRAAWNGSVIEVAVPVTSPRRGRVGVAWTTIRPAALPEAGSSVLIVLAPALLGALGAGFFVAMRVRRMTMSALQALNEDIELALSGHIPAVGDPLGARPVRDLADSVNYLITRARFDAEAPVADSGPSPGPAPVPARFPARIEARVVADPAFRVSDASPGCLELLGLKPAGLVGRHLLDALADGPTGDAVLKCLARVQSGGDVSVPVPESGMTLRVAREVEDGPVTITFTRDRVVAAP